MDPSDKKAYIIVLVSVGILLLLTLTVYLPYGDLREEHAEKNYANGSLRAAFIIDYGNGTVDTINKTFYARENKTYTALDGLKEIYRINHTYWPAVGGEFVDCINTVCTDKASNRFWFFFVNGKFSETGTGAYYLKEGDVILMNYTKNAWF